MQSNLKITSIVRGKIPLWKVDIVRNFALHYLAIPRKTHILGHFHLNPGINTEIHDHMSLIFS